MGTEDSKKYNQSTNTDINLNMSYTSSDFDQIKSFNSEESISKTKTKTDKQISSRENDEKILLKNNNNKYPVTFEWTGGGNSIYVSGSFCNWNQLFLMQKISEKNSF